MTITELIAHLEELKALHGDVQVLCWPYDGQGRSYAVEEIQFVTVKHDDKGLSDGVTVGGAVLIDNWQ